ncbi:MAG: acyltransferase family protein [Chitinophagales bacterium]
MFTPSAAYSDSKKHLLILDALRGIAALMVLMMHTFEVYCEGDYHKMLVNHGYLAVDFFFMLSGYVMAHAYDDRWDTMSVMDFAKRRLIRLQPLIVLGMTIGALLFFFQESSLFPKVAETSVSQVVLLMLIGYTLLPVPPSMDIRGWAEMHPLNGAAWSLFFEYIANVLHVLVLRKLSNWALFALVLLAAGALFNVAVYGKAGDLIGGWSTEPEQLKVGFTRLLFPYMAGMLLRRVLPPSSGKNTFVIAGLLLVLALGAPRLGGYDQVWLNGLYEVVVLVAVFPIILYLGAMGTVRNSLTQKLCTFLGDISYPLYITHFPIIYTYSAWVTNYKVPIEEVMPASVAVMLTTILVAYASLRWYDMPVRKWLTRRWMRTE